MSSNTFRPMEFKGTPNQVHASSDFDCACGQWVTLSVYDLEPFICACGRVYRLVARVEVDDSAVVE